MENKNQIYIKETGPEEYSLALTPQDVFLTPAFNELNQDRVAAIRYLVFMQGERAVGGIILGERNGELCSPFSAPYGGLTVVGDVSFTTIAGMAACLRDYCATQGKDCVMTFPAPVLHDNLTDTNQMFANALVNEGFSLAYNDLNFHLIPSENKVSQSKRQRYVKGVKEGFKLIVSSYDEQLLGEIFEILAENHRKLNYPMPMTFERYRSTASVVDFILFKVVEHDDPLAGGIAYVTRPDVMQIISWGDRVESRPKVPPMPFMACSLFEWVSTNMPEIKIIDLGPASSHGEPSAGLCDFKLELGAVPTLKQTLVFKCSLYKWTLKTK